MSKDENLIKKYLIYKKLIEEFINDVSIAGFSNEIIMAEIFEVTC